MPPRFVPPTSPRCPRCSKSVYSAEQVIGPNGTSWHKSCFTCRECNRRLDSSTLAEHEGEAYCKPCHKKMWGPTGYGYGAGLLVREDPESQFKQSIGRPVNSSGSNDDISNSTFQNLDQAIYSNTGGSSTGSPHPSSTQPSSFLPEEETEEQKRERLTPVNATLKKRNSLDMIREQAEASRRAYDDAHAQRLANKYGRVNANSTGDSVSSTGSNSGRNDNSRHLESSSSQSGYLSDTSSAFGSTMATTSSPAPSLSSISSTTSSQPPMLSLYLNQSLRPSSSNASSNQQRHQPDPQSDYEKNRQALSFQTGTPPPPPLPGSSGSSATTSPAPPSLPKRTQEPSMAISSSEYGNVDRDESYLQYVPIRVIARKEEPSQASRTTADPPVVKEDEWDTEPSRTPVDENKPKQLPMYRSQYLEQQRLQEQKQEQEQEQEQISKPRTSAYQSTTGVNRLINETDKMTLKEREERQQTQITASTETDEWDEEPTPTMPSKPQNMSYMPPRQVSSAATRTWTPSAVSPSGTPSGTNHSRTSSAEYNNNPASASPPVPVTTSSSVTPKSSYYRTGGIMTPKKATTSFGGGGDICPRCQKIVYHAESALAPGGAKYHKLCLRCVECSKSLDSTNMTDRQGTPYCKTCYGKAFGIKGYGYGSGASMLHTEL
ncbi:hypothetical protein BGX28_006302 [Mortierella sp. GBA30]|nr:hypothetical protein BGX28_006302 [Mortierella sp. GBA30]